MPQPGNHQPYTGPGRALLMLGRESGPAGTFGRVAHGVLLPRDPNDLMLWLPGQGPANAYGITTLAYVLRYLLGLSAPDRLQIDRSIRRAGIFSAPGRLVSQVRRFVLEARKLQAASAWTRCSRWWTESSR